MNNKEKLNKQQRLKNIEDRKIEILLEIAELNNNYNERVSRLDSEYTQLDNEYYQLRLLTIKKGRIGK
jgi:hypothetical protein